jgi:TRAP-type C4-dicarboxylate transport system permease small subunit
LARRLAASLGRGTAAILLASPLAKGASAREARGFRGERRVTVGALSPASGTAPGGGVRAAARPGWHAAEDLALALVLGAMILLPLAEAIARKLLGLGIVGAGPVVQHLVLVVGLLGGAAAARDGRLLALSPARALFERRLKSAPAIGAGVLGATVSAFLCAASVRYVALTRQAGETLAYGIPLWVVQLVLPTGFALIALRLWLRAAPGFSGRAVAAGLGIALALVAVVAPLDPERWVLPGLALVVLAALMGAPIFSLLGGAALILFWGQGSPIASLTIDHYRMVVNPSLPAIPLFTLAGYFLAEGGASRRLVRVFHAWVGGLRGGPAVLTALVCAFFTSFTGASGVTILALGGLLMPVLRSARYSERNALGLLTGAGSLGLLFPPHCRSSCTPSSPRRSARR